MPNKMYRIKERKWFSFNEEHFIFEEAKPKKEKKTILSKICDALFNSKK